MTNNHLCGDAPCKAGDIISVGQDIFKVEAAEPIFYRFTPLTGFFITGLERVVDLAPSNNRIHYITGFGIGSINMDVRVNYQAGHPRNTVGANSGQRISGHIAQIDEPFRTKFAILQGDTLEIDVAVVVGVQVTSEVIFYGWKLMVNPCAKPTGTVIHLEDVRNIGA